MSIFEAFLLGLIQGITEFLPVSSSGHLQLAKELMGVELTDNIAFDVTLHLATVLSTIVILWRTVRRLFTGLFAFRRNAETEYVGKILLSMIPVGIVGFTLKEPLNAMLASNSIILIVGIMLLLTALLLTFAYYARPRKKESISWGDAAVIGISQAVAVMPGLSRSGTTISTGLILGNKREAVAEFSFLMVILPIVGESLLDIVKGDFFAQTGVGLLPLAVGFLTSFTAGCLACKFMINIVKRGKLIWFAVYCAVVGLASIGFYLF